MKKLIIATIFALESACQMLPQHTAHDFDSPPHDSDSVDSGCFESAPDAGAFPDAPLPDAVTFPDALLHDAASPHMDAGDCPMNPTLPCDEVCPDENRVPWPTEEEPTQMICLPSYCRCLQP